MFLLSNRSGFLCLARSSANVAASTLIALSFSISGIAQDATAPQQPATSQSAPQPSASAPSAETRPASPEPDAASPSTSKSETSESGEINEDQLRSMLVGKQLFLRGGYLDNTLSYNEHGKLVDHSPQGSYTLSGIEIDKVHLSKNKLELEGQRYALHFLGAMPYEDPTAAVNRVKITPKKKIVKISIDRELVIKEKEQKDKGKQLKPTAKPTSMPATAAQAKTNASAPPTPGAPAPPPSMAPIQSTEASDAAQAQAEIAAAPPAERPADAKSVTTTTSPAHAAKVLLDSIDNVFAQPFDARMMADMPGFWKLYYDAVAAKKDYRPDDPSVLRQGAVDQKAKLVSNFEPPSNQYAQDNGVAGISLYHVVVGADGKASEVAVARPIGFGLDESAVDSIRKATFSPAIKDGKPVPVMLDLVVQFRIFSKLTAASPATEISEDKKEPILPGPYSVLHNN